MAEPGAAINREAILTLRRRVRFQDGRPYDARCGRVAAALEAQFGWTRQWGRLRLLDARVCWRHCWNQLADGRILDATADQFESRWLGDLVVLEADDSHATAYQPTPPQWMFTLREQEQVIELAAIALAGVAPLFGFTAIALGLIGYVTTLFKLSVIFTILWARLFLGEGQMRSRLFEACVMVVGGGLVAA